MVESLPLYAKGNYTRRVLNRARDSLSKTKTRRTQCKAGYIRRKGYVRKFDKGILEKGYTVKRSDGKMYRIKPSKEAVHVKSMCVKDKNPPGKQFGHIRKGEFKKYGYSYTEPVRVRRAALEKAIAEFGAQSVYYKLKNLARLSLREAPDASRAFKEDKQWVESHYRL